MTVARSCASIKKDRDFAQGALPGTCASIKKDRDFVQGALPGAVPL